VSILGIATHFLLCYNAIKVVVYLGIFIIDTKGGIIVGSKKEVDADTILKNYWRDNDRFSDLMNQIFFEGKNRIRSEFLEECGTNESNVCQIGESLVPIKRERDSMKRYRDGTLFILAGTEDQMRIHYGMPVRIMLYDALEYLKQCQELERKHRESKDLKRSDEFLSKMRKEDKMTPVFTLVLYYGEKEWDGSVRLGDMMEIPSGFETLVRDYKINLIELNKAGDIPFRNKENYYFFKISNELFRCKDKASRQTVQEKYSGVELCWETVAAIGAVTGSRAMINRATNREGDRIVMCEAIELWENDLREEGRELGREEGREEGIAVIMEFCQRMKMPVIQTLDIIAEKFNLSDQDALEMLHKIDSNVVV
jgi:hypothetical protein